MMAKLHISFEQVESITQLAIASYPSEGCGLLVGQRIFAAGDDLAQTDEVYRVVRAVVATENAWELSRLDYTDFQSAGETDHSDCDRYWIDPADLLAVQKSARQRGLEIIGIYHSHPDHPAVPSECDRALAWPVYSYVIVSVIAGQIVDLKSWRLDDDNQFQPEPVKMIGSSTNKAPFLS